MDHRELLKRYMASVIFCEGYDYLPRYLGADEEHAELETIATEARDEIDRLLKERKRARGELDG